MNIFGKQKILIPHNIDLQKWAVIACDQFTSSPGYWQKLNRFVGNSPSSLHITLPEIYLSDKPEERVQRINATMREYLDNGIMQEIDGIVLVEREVTDGKMRLGLVMSVDLESYDWKAVRSPIRATEDTIVERLPARVNIRRGALIELPHVLLLVDDSQTNIIKKIYAQRDKLTKLYDFELNMNGGRIRGYKITDTDEIFGAFRNILTKMEQKQRYGKDEGLLFIVGDGNHSLAAAKSYWETIKQDLTEKEREDHPARYALVEVVDLHDDAMLFEPIHRVIINSDEDFIDKLRESITGSGRLKVFTKDEEYILKGPSRSCEMIRQVQDFIEKYIKNSKKKVIVDYVHGESYLQEAVEDNENAIGIYMPYFAKDELFNYVLNVGNLPKKAFSIDRPERKKYYLEAKRIK